MVSEPRDRTPVLDHGYLELVEMWGSEERIVEAARMSTDKGFQGWKPEVKYVCSECKYTFVTHTPYDEHVTCPSNPGHGLLTYNLVHHGDEKLLAYLYKNHHMTPFEMAGMTIEVQAPIFVFREWHRHRTQSYNELSARYTPLPDVNYVPTVERCLMGGGVNKQAQSASGRPVTADEAASFITQLEQSYRTAEALYRSALDWGIPKETARLIIPVGRYSRMRASANLRNWLQFLTLRMDAHAQWEIRQYANAVGTLVEQHFPRVWALFAGG